ncbi:uncharacterized protein LOC107874030 [Capsicum annuum]|uniref:uncharacterized protein LOC107874030 n=1 Tax=Capsicum annuum TaxID=4072 RepID=UPI001FB18558|nr:uncharacterized protein LOC107874030 [Capsicum annuum]
MVHLEALDLWKAVEEDYEVTPLGDNPTVNQMRHHKERKTRKVKAKACLFSAVSPSILTRIMQMKSARMKESETIKDYADKLLDLANKVRLFGKDFTDERIAQKMLATLSEKYEATISSLENSKDLSSITLAELVNALQETKKNQKQMQGNNYNNQGGSNPPCPHYKKINHSQQKSTCFASKNTSENWLIDSGCTNYMTSDQNLFKDLDISVISKVKSGNGENLDAKGKGIVAIQSPIVLKLLTDIFCVPDLDQNLLSVGQLLENGSKVLFEEKTCVIKDSDNMEIFKVKMRGKSFSLNLLDGEQATVV